MTSLKGIWNIQQFKHNILMIIFLFHNQLIFFALLQLKISRNRNYLLIISNCALIRCFYKIRPKLKSIVNHSNNYYIILESSQLYLLYISADLFLIQMIHSLTIFPPFHFLPNFAHLQRYSLILNIRQILFQSIIFFKQLIWWQTCQIWIHQIRKQWSAKYTQGYTR